MNDALLIFPDDNKDGVADRCIEFAKVHNPVGFEFWNGGVIVTCQPDILFLKDTDGDDIADIRQVLIQGIGSADTHHAANNLSKSTANPSPTCSTTSNTPSMVSGTAPASNSANATARGSSLSSGDGSPNSTQKDAITHTTSWKHYGSTSSTTSVMRNS